MPTTRDPLAGVDLLLVDGSNLLYALSGRASEAGPPAAVIGRLRGIVPSGIAIQLVFDGPPDRGLGTARIASGIAVRYSGRRSADDVLVQLARERADAGAADGATLVVTDDRDLGSRLRRWRARVIGSGWLIGRLERARLSSPSAGRSTPPARNGVDTKDPVAEATAEAGESRRWQPGRGATTKRGNPRRVARSRSGPGRRGRG